MNELSLVYYGNLNEVQRHLLYLLNILKVRPDTQEHKGFYAIETRYGQEFFRKLSLAPDYKNTDDAVLIYRYLSDAEINYIKNNEQTIRYYILLHKMLDTEYIKKNVLTSASETWFIADISNSSLLQNYFDVKKIFNTKNVLKINSVNTRLGQNSENKMSIPLPVVVLLLMKLMVNPFNELKRYYILVQYSNLRMLSRMVELLLFIHFLIKAVLLKSLKIWSIDIFYRVRHISIYCGKMAFYRIRHIVLMSIYYSEMAFYRIRHIVLMAFYRIRHIVLMSIFKSYGIFFDLFMFLYRFTKLVLMYPIFKIYWFASFQYNKRIKKYFLYDR